MPFEVPYEEYPVLKQMTYLDTPFQGLVPRSTWARIHEHCLEESDDFAHHDAYWRHALREEITQEMASMIGLSQQEVALVPGFTVGLRQLIPWLGNFKKVVLIEGDYPTLVDAFTTGLFEVSMIPRNADGSFEIETLAHALELNQGGVLAWSHVHNVSGYRSDVQRIGALARANQVTTVMDLTQTFGTIPVDLSAWPVDCTVCSTYKWTGSGFGVGFVSVRNGSKKMNRTVEQLSMGHLDPYAMLRLRYGLARLKDLGIARIHAHNAELVEKIVQGLKMRGIGILSNLKEAHRSVILSFEGNENLQRKLMGKGVRTSFREKGIRVGPHWYNTDADVDALLAALDA